MNEEMPSHVGQFRFLTNNCLYIKASATLVYALVYMHPTLVETINHLLSNGWPLVMTYFCTYLPKYRAYLVMAGP
jgi:hypothetical protein